MTATATDSAPATKRCSRCHEHKPRDAFGKNAARPDGRAVYCRACRAGRTVAIDATTYDVKLGGGRWLRVARRGGLVVFMPGTRDGRGGFLSTLAITVRPDLIPAVFDAARAVCATE